jgi:hypothetical protein
MKTSNAKTVTYTLPLFWASYLINRDASGYTELELSWMHYWQCAHASLGDALDMTEVGFSRRHGQEMAEYVFPVLD